MSTDPNDYANPYVLGPENFNPGPTLREQVAMMILHRLLGATLRPGATEPTTADLCNAAWRTADMFIAAGEETAQETGGAMRNETAAAESPVAEEAAEAARLDDSDPQAPPGVLAKEYEERLKAFEAEAAANDKAIQDMNEDKVEKLARVLFRKYHLYAYPDQLNRMERDIFYGADFRGYKPAWLSVARAAIDHLKESKWKAIALDLCAHLRKTLPVMDDAREDARRLGRQSVVDAFDRQTDAARTAIAIAEGGSK